MREDRPGLGQLWWITSMLAWSALLVAHGLFDLPLSLSIIPMLVIYLAGMIRSSYHRRRT